MIYQIYFTSIGPELIFHLFPTLPSKSFYVMMIRKTSVLWIFLKPASSLNLMRAITYDQNQWKAAVSLGTEQNIEKWIL